MFANRVEAGRLLAQELITFCNDDQAILLALPRGGVVVAYQLSLALHLPLDVLVTRKIGAPGNPEFALGAICETGAIYWNREATSDLPLSTQQRHSAVRAQEQEIARRVGLYRQGRPFPDLTGRTIIVVDDGLATGATFFASVAAIRQKRPRRILGAVPVAPRAAVQEARNLLDQLIVLDVPDPFYSVGNFYSDFTQVDDQEVLQCLRSAREALLAVQPGPTPPPGEAPAVQHDAN